MAVENEVVQNEFGTVTDRRIVYFRGKGLLSGGSREDVPLKHVTSVRVETERKIGWACFMAIVGLVCLVGLSGQGPVFPIVGIVVLVVATILIWGFSVVVINTAGGDLNYMKAWAWKRQEAEKFVEAVRRQLFME